LAPGARLNRTLNHCHRIVSYCIVSYCSLCVNSIYQWPTSRH